MTAEVAERNTSTQLAIADDQASFTTQQVAVLRHMGVEGAPAEDLEVFFHACKRSGLDPFLKQIHMIKRMVWNPQTQQKEPRWTIQTGIDGYRLMGRRAADRARQDMWVGEPEWLHDDGTWRPAWTKRWGAPIAARVKVYRGGHSFTGIANFDEYVQTKQNGSPVAMWEQRPAGQIAKCAEALAWRLAFPQDMAGVYIDDEMHQADNPAGGERQQPRGAVSAAQFTSAAENVDTVTGEVVDAEEVGPEDPTPDAIKAMFAGFTAAGFASDARTSEGRRDRLAYMSQILQRPVDATKDLTADDVERVTDALAADAADLAGQDES